QTPEIFHPLKALEARYINLNTDPFYLELVTILEKAITLLASNRPESLAMVQSALDRGQFALERIFPHDSRLKNLVWTLTSNFTTVRKRFEGPHETKGQTTPIHPAKGAIATKPTDSPQ